MDDLLDYQCKIKLLGEKIDLGRLCGCQLREFSRAIRNVDPDHPERMLAFMYLESLIQGFIYTFDAQNYWEYIRLIQNMQITMTYHDGEVQFRLMLMIPEHDRSFRETALINSTRMMGSALLPLWLRAYENNFGSEAVKRIKQGVQWDSDVSRLITEFPFLKDTLETTFCFEESA